MGRGRFVLGGAAQIERIKFGAVDALRKDDKPMSTRFPLFIAALCWAFPQSQAQPTAQNTTAVEHVNVVDVVAGEIHSDQTVLISNGRISIAGPAASVAHPPEARIIRAQGMYLLPGLWDMHVVADSCHANRCC